MQPDPGAENEQVAAGQNTSDQKNTEVSQSPGTEVNGESIFQWYSIVL